MHTLTEFKFNLDVVGLINITLRKRNLSGNFRSRVRTDVSRAGAEVGVI